MSLNINYTLEPAYHNNGVEKKTNEILYEKFHVFFEKLSKKKIEPLNHEFSKTTYIRMYDYVKTIFEDEYNMEYIKKIFNNKIPTVTTVSNDFETLNFLIDNFDEIKFHYFQLSTLPTKEEPDVSFSTLFEYKSCLFYCLSKTINIVYTDFSFITNNKELFEFLYEKYNTVKEKISIFMVLRNQGYYLNNFDIQNVENDIFDNYNEDLLKVHEKILIGLKEQQKGIIVLDGKKGTGKSTYIRHLIKSVPDKKFIFIPSFLHNNLTNTEFITFLTNKCRNSVLILEDCEIMIKSREQGGNGAVSDLLNMADGLMSDVLNVQFICTFNTERTNVDDALLRPGRLIAEYQFEELTRDKVENLCKKLGKETSTSGYICDIYNSVPPKNKKENKKIELK